MHLLELLQRSCFPGACNEICMGDQSSASPFHHLHPSWWAPLALPLTPLKLHNLVQKPDEELWNVFRIYLRLAAESSKVSKESFHEWGESSWGSQTQHLTCSLFHKVHYRIFLTVDLSLGLPNFLKLQATSFPTICSSQYMLACFHANTLWASAMQY